MTKKLCWFSVHLSVSHLHNVYYLWVQFKESKDHFKVHFKYKRDNWGPLATRFSSIDNTLMYLSCHTYDATSIVVNSINF